MSYNLIILEFAEQDIQGINFNYKSIRKELAIRFNKSLRREIKIIHKNPFLYQIRYDNVRLALIEKFPYKIHFVVYSDAIVIKAIYHTSRDSKVWFNRD
jgi:hypothetical protein